MSSPDGATAPVDAHISDNSTPAWSVAATKTSAKLSLPLYESFGPGSGDIPLSNFSSLLVLPESPLLPSPASVAHVKQLRRKRVVTGSSSPRTPSPIRKRACDISLTDAALTVSSGAEHVRSAVDDAVNTTLSFSPDHLPRTPKAPICTYTLEPTVGIHNSGNCKYPLVNYILLGDSTPSLTLIPEQLFEI